ncbi:DUF3231 family protein [Bacillus lacus]|uniref:DUF3231 family protein n=1 Tax=Metabacillus lacus TaxID=1983721 RepID=A0A7X2J0B5_9BACI|nr:DUF3231 family protein [Metabacillus lacus]MRX73098.1 DUF3231 family protein [Metabacillus lacus]
MANPIEAFINIFKEVTDHEETSPLHVIEVGDCWTYLATLEEFIRFEEMGMNTTTDDDLVEMLKDALKICQKQAERLSGFLLKEGVELPNVTPPKPSSSPNEIPPGVKLSDDDISNGIAFKAVNLMIMAGKGQADSVRTDVGIMWFEFFTEFSLFGASLKRLMKKRGWLKVPPYYYSSGSSGK